MAEVELAGAADRTSAGKAAGDIYEDDLEAIHTKVDKADESGSTLGNMIEASLDMTEATTEKNVREGIPRNVSKTVKGESDGIKSGSS